MAEDLRLAGMSAVPPADSDPGEEDFEVWGEGWDSWMWFVGMSRRWIFNAFNGKRVRFDDQAVLTQLKVQGVKKDKRKTIMEDLLIMEAAALEVLNRE